MKHLVLESCGSVRELAAAMREAASCTQCSREFPVFAVTAEGLCGPCNERIFGDHEDYGK